MPALRLLTANAPRRDHITSGLVWGVAPVCAGGYGRTVITPEQAVNAVNERFGLHPGYRALHAKGNLYRGTFTATPEAARLTRAAHMQGQPVEATVRFSNGSGDPGSPDFAQDVRGMATKFHLPDGSGTDISAQTVPRFPVSTPEAFIDLVRANAEGAARLWKLPLFLVRNPGVVPALKANAPSLRPPASYAGVPYFAVHAFRWIDAQGGERYVRYRWEPETPEGALSKQEAESRGPDYLQEEMKERLGRGPVRFTLMLQIAGEGDTIDDPASEWPQEREQVTAGTLEVTALEAGRETSGEVLVFDPVRVTDGIEPSSDPVLLFRPRAYSVSVDRRVAAGPAAKGATAASPRPPRTRA
jgi:catalase